ncbi:hypothetical protein ABIA33_004935 [Streptacidiphilus sp. MAP12-16]|uniref:hypothetical protein n=1 Tax=Streptacidiphilus sp. MAP12-16 TaxID=3156300 RepID=UPI0035127BC0
MADVLEGITFAVRTRKYCGGGSIDIVIRNIPQEWGYTTGVEDRGNERRTATAALKALLDELRPVHGADNYDGSDLRTDHFDVNYYGGVRAEQPEGWAGSI